jgi:hypothetical protein
VGGGRAPATTYDLPPTAVTYDLPPEACSSQPSTYDLHTTSFVFNNIPAFNA